MLLVCHRACYSYAILLVCHPTKLVHPCLESSISIAACPETTGVSHARPIAGCCCWVTRMRGISRASQDAWRIACSYLSCLRLQTLQTTWHCTSATPPHSSTPPTPPTLAQQLVHIKYATASVGVWVCGHVEARRGLLACSILLASSCSI